MKIIFLMLFSISAFAAIPEFSELRDYNDVTLKKLTMTSINNCDSAAGLSYHVQSNMRTLDSAVRILTSEQDAGKTERVLALIKLAHDEANGLNRDCQNSSNYSKILIEMYLVNIDTELMILQYGVGKNLYRE
jgi:hypothetical protein